MRLKTKIMMTTVEAKANLVAQQLVSSKIPQTEAFAPAAILVIVQIITAIVQAIQACPSIIPSSSIVDVMAKPSIFQKLRLRATVLRMITPHPRMALYSSKLTAAVLSVGQQVTQADVTAMLTEVSNS